MNLAIVRKVEIFLVLVYDRHPSCTKLSFFKTLRHSLLEVCLIPALCPQEKQLGLNSCLEKIWSIMKEWHYYTTAPCHMSHGVSVDVRKLSDACHLTVTWQLFDNHLTWSTRLIPAVCLKLWGVVPCYHFRTIIKASNGQLKSAYSYPYLSRATHF